MFPVDLSKITSTSVTVPNPYARPIARKAETFGHQQKDQREFVDAFVSHGLSSKQAPQNANSDRGYDRPEPDESAIKSLLHQQSAPAVRSLKGGLLAGIDSASFSLTHELPRGQHTLVT